MYQYLISIILACILSVCITACNSNEEKITLFPLDNYNQQIENWINPNDPDYDRPLLDSKLQQNHFDLFYQHYFGAYSPWDSDHIKKNIQQPYPDDVKTTEKSHIALYSNRKKSPLQLGFGENFRPYSEMWTAALEANMNLTQFDNLHYDANQRAIAVDNLHARIFPTDEVFFYNYKIAGEGYPFDNLQMAALWAGTPVYILGETRDHAWNLVLTPDYAAWVKSTGIARVNDKFIDAWKAAAKKQLIAITRTQTSIIDSNNKFRLSAYVGSVFPGEENVTGFNILFPIADIQQNAVIAHAAISSNDAVTMPIPATLHNFSRIMSTLLGRPYGWGNMYFYNDCSAELKSFFTPFGIWLPPGSADQVNAGRVVNMAASSPNDWLFDLKWTPIFYYCLHRWACFFIYR